MGNDTKAWLRHLAKEGFGGRPKDSFYVIYGKKKHKIVYRGELATTVSITPSENKSFINLVHQLRKRLNEIDARLDEKVDLTK